jgi:hypothetical protein
MFHTWMYSREDSLYKGKKNRVLFIWLGKE